MIHLNVSYIHIHSDQCFYSSAYKVLHYCTCFIKKTARWLSSELSSAEWLKATRVISGASPWCESASNISASLSWLQCAFTNTSALGEPGSFMWWWLDASAARPIKYLLNHRPEMMHNQLWFTHNPIAYGLFLKIHAFGFISQGALREMEWGFVLLISYI